MNEITLLPSIEILQKRSKNLTYRKMVYESNFAILKYLKEKNLLLINPFNPDGSPILNLSIMRPHVTTEGYKLFQKPINLWRKAREKDSNYSNIDILEKWFLKIKNGECTGGNWIE
jgi:hypothetical protein